jgi:adenylosuccinate synthase
MSNRAIVGAQWGDEGKGKFIDYFAGQADVVVRSQGGNNAGHTVVVEGETFKLHLMPSGILHKGTPNFIGAGVVLEPRDFLSEIDNLAARGFGADHLMIDVRAHIVLPWHIALDRLSEENRGGDSIGTTCKGIGPCYMDKYERIGLRFYDLIHPEIFAQKARITGALKNRIITEVYGGEAIDLEAVIAEYTAYGERLAKYAGDVSLAVNKALSKGKNVLFEGAQSTLLDIDWGTYPYVTSSHPVSTGVCIGSGVGPGVLDEIIGMAKAYITRVGNGPFPTELTDSLGDLIRKKGAEFGTTTGRPRRIGWFDACVIRHCVRVNGLTSFVVNKFDTLQNVGDLKVCVAYKKPSGEIITELPPVIEELEGCEPVYEVFKGFTEDISGCQTFDDLPQNCKDYVFGLEKLCGCRVSMIGVGPDRKNIIVR